MSTFDPNNPKNLINPTPDAKLYITLLSILSIVFSGYIQSFNLLTITTDTYKQIKHIGLILLISGSVMLFLTLFLALLKYKYDTNPYFIISIVFSGIAIAWGTIAQLIIIPTDNSTPTITPTSTPTITPSSIPLTEDSSKENSLGTIQILKDFSYSIGIISVFALGFCIGQYMKKDKTEVIYLNNTTSNESAVQNIPNIQISNSKIKGKSLPVPPRPAPPIPVTLRPAPPVPPRPAPPIPVTLRPAPPIPPIQPIPQRPVTQKPVPSPSV